MLRSGPFGCREVPRMREARPHDLAPRRLVTVNTKAHRDGRTHLDGRAAAFRIALRKVSIAHRVERAFDIDGYEEPGTDRHLLDVGIAAILPWRNGAQTLPCHFPPPAARRFRSPAGTPFRRAPSARLRAWPIL